MEGNCRTVPLFMGEIKGTNDNATRKATGTTKRPNVSSLNTHLICALCSGYYVEATAIVDCLHTFCRSCIVKYLQSNSFCPICDVQIHQSKPWSSLRPDKIVQDLVYKLVPGLYKNEMRRRRNFYTQLGRKPETVSGEEEGCPSQGARFFSQDDSISLSLEYYNWGGEDEDDDEEKMEAKDSVKFNDKPKRYLQCPAAVTMRHLKKFLRMKYGIGLDCWVDIIYNHECLPDDFTLIDVAYTFSWKRASPMKFSYRIFSKTTAKTFKSQNIPIKNQKKRLNEEEKVKSKRQSSLEQQMQNEYLGNFNLNPTNSSIYKNQNKTKSYRGSLNNNNHSVRNHNVPSGRKLAKKDECVFKNVVESEEGSNDRVNLSSEESNTSDLQIISEKEEESPKEKSDDDDSLDLIPLGGLIRRKAATSSVSITNFGEENAVDGFSAKKLLRSKHKAVGKRDKRKSEELPDRRRKSDGFENPKKGSEEKRRKSLADEYSLKQEVGIGFTISTKEKEEESIGNLKNEALRKVFIAKDKPELAYNGSNEVTTNKKKDGDFRRKKRKKSKHHEGETKRRKTEIIASSPSIMSFAKDALKFKFKLTPTKPPTKSPAKENEEKRLEVKNMPAPIEEIEEMEMDEGEGKEKNDTDSVNDRENEEEDAEEKTKSNFSEKETKKTETEGETKKSATDKERLLHLRAVRHKPVVNKSSPKDYLNTPPSLTISKIDSSESSAVKSALIESKPSLEIMLVSPVEAAKPKKVELKLETSKESGVPKKLDCSEKDGRQKAEFVDNFGVLDLSEKSTRTKETTPSNSASSKEAIETVERYRKSTHQSILQIAQTLVNRKLSPMLGDNPVGRGGFDGSGESTAAAMRNLKTLSDTAVNILMAAQSKSFASCAAELQKHSLSSLSTASTSASQTLKSLIPMNSRKSSKDCENGTGLKIPMYSISREKSDPIPPVPNLHEIYPRGRGRPVPLGRPCTPAIKPGQNQTVRHIPNPFVVLNRQTNQSGAVKGTQIPPGASPNSENGSAEDLPSKPKSNCIPPLQSIKSKITGVRYGGDADGVNGTKNNSSESSRASIPKLNLNNNTPAAMKNCLETSLFGLKNNSLEERKGNLKLSNNNNHGNVNSIRKIENMAKNIETVAAGLTARAVSNAMVDTK